MNDSWSVPRLYAVLTVMVCLVLGGVGGYFLRGDRTPASPGVPVKVTKPKAGLPPGFKQLPIRKFGHWNLVCVQNDRGVKLCDMVLRVVDKDSKKLLMSLVVSNKVKTSPLLVVITPPSAALPEGVKMVPEGRAETKLTFASCKPGSCEAVSAFNDSIKDALSSSGTVTVSYIAAGGHPVQYKLPLDGFRDAYAAWLDAIH